MDRVAFGKFDRHQSSGEGQQDRGEEMIGEGVSDLGLTLMLLNGKSGTQRKVAHFVVTKEPSVRKSRFPQILVPGPLNDLPGIVLFPLVNRLAVGNGHVNRECAIRSALLT